MLRPQRLPNGERGLRSEVLGLWVYLQGQSEALRWHDPAPGRDLEDHDEVHDAREAAEAKLAEAAAAREAAEAELAEAAAARQAAEGELAELRAQVRRLRRESGT